VIGAIGLGYLEGEAVRHHRFASTLVRVGVITGAVVVGLGGSFVGRASGVDTSVNVTGSSPSTPFPQNKQNEPAVAIDPNNPTILAAGSNDELDLAPCGTDTATSSSPCPFTPGVGVSGVYFSTTSGHSWTQPTYTGWSARSGTSAVGDIGTLPWYYEHGLVSDGDPGVAFGPVFNPVTRTFSWANGSRLYYSNLTSNFPGAQAFKGFEAIGVSRTDDVAAAAAGGTSGKAAWMPPVVVSKQNSALFSDKVQIWADNAATSTHFGNAYVCYAAFRGLPGRSQPLFVARSTDGGTTWANTQVTDAAANAPARFGQTGCTIRTDSKGTVDVFYMQFTKGLVASHNLVQSFDGGVTWTRPRQLFTVNDMCFNVDPVEGRCVFDGIAGTRLDLGPAPSVSIANGAPSGAGATDEIVDSWSDGRDGLNHEKTLVAWSTDGGGTWSAPVTGSQSGDRSEFSAPAIAPDGSTLYLTYLGWSTDYQPTFDTPRTMFGVFRSATIGSGGAPGTFVTVNQGQSGDARGSSANSLGFEFIGDYVYTAATPTYGVGIWMDARNAADCPAIDSFRASLYTSSPLPHPNPTTACTGAATNFGNTDIYASTTAP
jgi:hypothetical protein